VNPNVKILLAQLIPALGYESDISTLNSEIATLASNKNTGSSPVILVDQNSGFSASTDTYDGLHPNGTGDSKMADRWYSALAPLI